MPTDRHSRPARRRGNSLVMVTAILVLLVIAATAFLSRTRSGRAVAAAENAAASHRQQAETLHEELAEMVAEALFPAPVDTGDPALANPNAPDFGFASPNWPRLPRSGRVAEVFGDNARYAVDPWDEFDPLDYDGDGVFAEPDGQPDFSYNFAPYSVIPWTNWPAVFNRIDDAPGEPGFGDGRLWRSTEPHRWDPGDHGIDHRFSHWPHLTYVPTAENGWRVVADIGNVMGPGNIVDDLRVPVEQWPQEILESPGDLRPQPSDGTASFVLDFRMRRDAWFGLNSFGLGPLGRLEDYFNVYASPATALPNLWDLKTLGPPGDEFVPGTKRNIVSRTFADTDGDGVTDALWMLAPTSPDPSLKHLVAVSIVDNSGLLNANVASRFVHRDSDDLVAGGVLVPRTATTGATPADLALVGAANVTGTGFLDSVLNQQGVLFGALYPGVTIDWDPMQWSQAADGLTLMDALGVLRDDDPNEGGTNYVNPAILSYLPNPPELASAAARRAYWKRAGLRPSSPLGGLTPFGAAEELELRAYHGQNIAPLLSRFERAVATPSPTNSFLRSMLNDREETSEYVDQLLLAEPAGTPPSTATYSQLLFDHRRKLTMFSGACNDVMPTWLWPAPLPPRPELSGDPLYVQRHDLIERATNAAGTTEDRWTRPELDPTQPDPDDAITAHDLVRWSQLIRKLDLRAMLPNPWLMRDLDGNGFINETAAQYGPNGEDDYELQAREQRALMRDHLLRIVRRCFVGDNGVGYFGSGASNVAKSRSLAASFAANVEAWMDGPRMVPSVNPAFLPMPLDRPLSFEEARLYEDPSNPGRRFIGAEKQPFIMEAFVAHVYAKSKVPEDYPGPLFPDDVERVRVPVGQPDDGEHFVDGNSKVHTVAVVQIANPYNTPLVLATRRIGVAEPPTSDFRVRLFGQSYKFSFDTCDNVRNGVFETVKVDTTGDNVPDFEQLVLLPCTEDEPRTAVIYAIPPEVDDPLISGGKDIHFGAKWRDFLDIGLASDKAPEVPAQYLGRELFEDPRTPGPDSLRFNAGPSDPAYPAFPNNGAGVWSTTNPDIYDESGESSVEILRSLGGSSLVVVDRLDFSTSSCSGGMSPWDFRAAVARLRSDPDHRPPDADYFYAPPPNDFNNYFNGIRIGNNDYFVVWARASRHWRNDFIPDNVIDNREKAPRYVFADRPESDLVQTQQIDKSYVGQSPSTVIGAVFKSDQDPDAQPWLKSDSGSRRKPTYFTTRSVQTGPDTYEYPDGFPVPAAAFPDTSPGLPVDPAHANPAAPSPNNWIAVAPPLPLRIADKLPESAGAPPLDAPFQMLHPDFGFTRVGDLALVPLWGPVVSLSGGLQTVYTLGEILSGCAPEYPVEETAYVNRLRLFDDANPTSPETAGVVGPPLPSGSVALNDNPALFRPFLPAGVGLFDAFVCDGPGSVPLMSTAWNSALGEFIVRASGYPSVDPDEAEALSPRGAAGGYGGLDTTAAGSLVLGLPWTEMPVHAAIVRAPGTVHGLINVNTAPVEVLRTLPHMSWLVHSESLPTNSAALALTRVRVPEATIQYRDRVPPLNGFKPGYANRGVNTGNPLVDDPWFPGMRTTPGIESVGELLLLRRPSQIRPPEHPVAGGGWSAAEEEIQKAAFRIDFAAGAKVTGGPVPLAVNQWGFDPGNGLTPAWPQVNLDGTQRIFADARLSTDVFPVTVSPRANPHGASYLVPASGQPRPAGDGVSADAEEASLLFAGISNLITTRSDVFTVYFRVRTVRQNPTTGVWDGTDRDSIVDDARYVMLVDRSRVRRPGDAPQVVYFEKLPP